MPDQIADIRKDYQLKSFTEAEALKDAIMQFELWWKEAVASEIIEPNAMTLATASCDGLPSARIVLLKGFNERGFTFFTNYNSYKARQLDENPRACLVFFWKELERQIRITGIIEKVNDAESNDYFSTRPESSRISAIASPQSQVISSREWLEGEVSKVSEKFNGKTLQRPENWGGYIVRPITIEFWQGRLNRLHDRLQYALQEDGSWKIERLAP